MSGAQLNRVLSNPEVAERLLRERTINHEYDMPYVGGYSVDGSTIYLDRHLPDEIELYLDGQKKLVQPVVFLADYKGHEPVEWSVMDGLGWEYGPAHSGPATGSERRKVLSYLGPGWWVPWQTAIGKYVKADAHEKIQKMPADYDLRPILYPPVNEKLLITVQRAMGGKQAAKRDKAEVSYEKVGMAKTHCGPTKGWPASGECEHFQKPNSCELVKGLIHSKGWCELWKH